MKIEELPYHDNSAEYFSRLAHLPYAILLDSCYPHFNGAHFDIMSALPQKVIDNNVFLHARAALKTLQSSNSPSIKLPFYFGAIGYLSYDSGKDYWKLPKKTIHDINLPTQLMGIYDWSIVTDHHNKKTFLIMSFDEKNHRHSLVKNLLNQSPEKFDTFSLKKPFKNNTSKIDYQKAFEQIQHHIRQGDCYQTCLCQRFESDYSGDPWNAYQKLREQNPSPFSCFMRLPTGAILSVSPERFLQCREGQLETKPIKGTSPRHQDPVEDKKSAETLLQSEKDRAENIMIVDLLRNDLGKVCEPGSIKVPKLCALESFPNVHHLVSTITGKLDPKKDAFDILEHTFPGGSITGAPKLSAMNIIEQNETHHRSIYCGSIGYIDAHGNMDTNIAIRTLICHDGHIYCYGGGGIVADSKMENEYQESLVKVRRLMNILEEFL